MNVYRQLSEYSLKSVDLHFSYASVSFDDYKRKFEALEEKNISHSHPLLNLLQAVARIAPLILNGLLSIFTGIEPVKKQAFLIIRNLEEAAGSVIYKFNPVKGAYFIQEAQFHIEAYGECVQANARFHEIMKRFPFNTLEDLDMNAVLDLKGNDLKLFQMMARAIVPAGSHYSSNLFDWRIVKFWQTDGHQIALRFNDKSSLLFNYLTDEQIHQIKIDELSDAIVLELFGYNPERLKVLNSEQLVKVLNRIPDVARHIDKIENMDLARLKLKALVELISNPVLEDCFSDQILEPFVDRLIAKFDLIKNEKVRRFICAKIEEKGLQNFDFNVIRKTLKNIQLLSRLKIDQLQSIVQIWFPFIPFKWLKELDLSSITFEQFERVSKNLEKYNPLRYWELAPLSLIEANLHRIPLSAWKYLSQDVKDKIDRSKLTKEQLAELC